MQARSSQREARTVRSVFGRLSGCPVAL